MQTGTGRGEIGADGAPAIDEARRRKFALTACVACPSQTAELRSVEQAVPRRKLCTSLTLKVSHQVRPDKRHQVWLCSRKIIAAMISQIEGDQPSA